MHTNKQYAHTQTICTQTNNMHTKKQYAHKQTICTQTNNMHTNKQYAHTQTRPYIYVLILHTLRKQRNTKVDE